MIIQKIKLHPFAGVTNREYLFEDGLNVICGPNEAGKSTVVKALTMVLFEKTNPTPAKERELLKDILPVTGGNTIRVDLHFTIEGKNYILKKSWGGTRSSNLHIEKGAEISNDYTVQEKLQELLQLNEATYKHVLITYQSQLGHTVNNLRGAKEVSNSLSELLRNSVMQQDGVQVDMLKNKLTGVIDEYYGNWDVAAGGPNNNRDIENPYQKGNGVIINAYYKLKFLQKELKDAIVYEQQLDELVEQLNLANKNLKELQEYVGKNKAAVEDAKKREKIEGEQKSIDELYSQLTEIYERWPALEQKLKSDAEILENEQKRLNELEQELGISRKKDAVKTLKQQYEQAKKLQDELITKIKAQQQLQVVSEADISKAEKLEKQVENLRIKIEAQKLKLSVLAKSAVNGSIKEGLNEQESFHIEKGQDIEKIIQGKFTIELPELTLSVESGNADISALLNELDKAMQLLQVHYNSFKVAALADMKAQLKQLELSNIEIKQLKSNLNTVLKGAELEQLELQYKEFEKLPDVRSIDSLNDERVQVLSKIKSLAAEKQQVESEIKKLTEKHISKAELMKRLVRGEAKKTENEVILEKLQPLPEGYSSAENFISEFEKKSEGEKKLTEQSHQLQLRRAELEKEQPQSSVEELKEAITAAEADFFRRKEEGAAYLKIQQKLNEMLEVVDKQTYEPLQLAVNKYISSLTDKKYSSLTLEETNASVLKNGTKELQMQHLSKGTLDAAALAIKLGMADFYLKEREGFLLMDDPLVDLDPQRQKLAAATLQQYAENRQVIILTCHPQHAELLKKEFVEI